MYIREAKPEDNDELQQLQARCPQGRSIVASTVNTPDFFARIKGYECYKVFVSCDGGRIVGSAAYAIYDAVINGKTRRVGYELQYFTSPDYRRAGIAKQLHQKIEENFIQNNVGLSYTIIMEDNLPSMRLFESEGFRLHRTLVMPALAIIKEMGVPSMREVRPVQAEDMAKVAELLNKTWQDRELFKPASAEILAQFISRTPVFSSDNLLVLEEKGEILACLGFWDWSQVTRVTVRALNLKMRMIGWLLVTTRILPGFPKTGDTLKQMILTLIGFKKPADLAVLVRYVNNQARLKGIEQIFFICEQDDALLKSMKGFIRVDTKLNLYVKPLQQNVALTNKPVFINGIDL